MKNVIQVLVNKIKTKYDECLFELENEINSSKPDLNKMDELLHEMTMCSNKTKTLSGLLVNNEKDVEKSDDNKK